MSELTNGSFDNEIHDAIVNSLKTNKPRAPHIEWRAIQNALDTKDSSSSSLLVPTHQPSVLAAPRFRPAVAWLSGMAAGVVITLCAMQWIVLNDLSEKITRVEPAANGHASNTIPAQATEDRNSAGSEVLLDIDKLLDGPELTAAWFHTWPLRLVHARPLSNPNESTPQPKSIDIPNSTGHESSRPGAITNQFDDADADHPEQLANRLLLRKELLQHVH
ncbi:MAG: hypothetical protein FJ308_21420 [Planctomycetes bacterium]|nr:hypothetical protein [Planctomycetota bacterium]